VKQKLVIFQQETTPFAKQAAEKALRAALFENLSKFFCYFSASR